MNFIEWLLKGASDTIHDIHFIMALVLTVGPALICVAWIWMCEGRWLHLSLGILTALYGLYYFEERSKQGEETNE